MWQGLAGHQFAALSQLIYAAKVRLRDGKPGESRHTGQTGAPCCLFVPRLPCVKPHAISASARLLLTTLLSVQATGMAARLQACLSTTSNFGALCMQTWR